MPPPSRRLAEVGHPSAERALVARFVFPSGAGWELPHGFLFSHSIGASVKVCPWREFPDDRRSYGGK